MTAYVEQKNERNRSDYPTQGEHVHGRTLMREEVDRKETADMPGPPLQPPSTSGPLSAPGTVGVAAQPIYFVNQLQQIQLININLCVGPVVCIGVGPLLGRGSSPHACSSAPHPHPQHERRIIAGAQEHR